MTVYAGQILAGDVNAEERGSSLGEMIGARVRQTVFEGPTAQLLGMGEIAAAGGLGDLEMDEAGGFRPARTANQVPEIDYADAHARIKAEGFEKDIHLPAQDTIKAPVLDIMLRRAKERKERADTVARGPAGFIPSALTEATSFLVGALDPLNVSTAFIPVIGELRYGKLLAAAGDNILARAAVAAGAKGAPAGAIGMAALQPLEWGSRSQEGRDFTMAEALHNVAFGAALGAALVGGGRGVADVVRRRRELPAYPYGPGEVLESHTPYADVAPALRQWPPLAREAFPGAREPANLPERFPGTAAVSERAPEAGQIDIAAFDDMAQPLPAPPEMGPPTPLAEFIAALPKRAQEDAVRTSMAALAEGRPVAAGELLAAAYPQEPAAVARAQIYDDVRAKLLDAGLTPEEAEAHATLWAARYSARAARVLGRAEDAFDLYREEGLQVRRSTEATPVAQAAEQAARRTAPPEPNLFTEREAEGQTTLPGAERISEAELARRRAAEPLRPSTAQKPMDIGLFGDEAKQRELFQAERYQVDTSAENFKRWSKGAPLVTADAALSYKFETGTPVVVEAFHGTNKSFTAFERRYRGRATGAWSARMGDFSASDPKVASSYAVTTSPYDQGIIGHINVMDWYGRFNEAILRALGRPSLVPEGANVMPIYVRMENPLVVDFRGRSYRERSYAMEIERAKEQGRDGVVMRNTFDEGFEGGGSDATNVYVSFHAEQVKSKFNSGRWGSVPHMLFQPGQPSWYYSAVGRAIESKGPAKASPEQWLATIRNTPGVKAEEIHWLGLEDWMKEQQGPVTKKQVADYVRANQIEVREVERGAAFQPEVARRREQIADRLHAIQDEFNRLHGDEAARAQRRALAEEEQRLTHEYNQIRPEPAVKFTGFMTPPGGTNPREFMLTLPRLERDTTPPDAQAVAKYGAEWDRIKAQIEPFNKRFEQGDRSVLPEINRLHEQLDALHSKMVDETMERVPAHKRADYRVPSGHAYGDEASDVNRLAHIFTDDRMIDGEKTLLVRETQSDWHQKGQHEGYQSKPPLTELPEGWRVEPTYLNGVRRYQVVDATGDQMGYAATEREAVETVLNRYNLANKKGVPDAPFKTTWPALAMKRMIRYAAENGYAKLAWVTGETVAERYDLSRHLTDMKVLRSAGDKPRYTIDATIKGRGERTRIAEQIPEDALADHVGKEMADKIRKDISAAQNNRWGVKNNVSGNWSPRFASKEEALAYQQDLPEMTRGQTSVLEMAPKFSAEYSGLDLKVGGEFHRKLYDQVLLREVNALVKKYGAKVEEAELKAAPEHVFPIEGGFEVRNAEDLPPLAFFTTRADAERWIESGRAERKGESVHVLSITPELRKVATEQGFPLFQETGGGPRGRIVFDTNRALIELFASADRSTFLHESGHLWLDETMRDAARPDAPAGIKADLATLRDWMGLKEGEEITTAAHEQFARGFETYMAEGVAPTAALARVFAAFKQWLLAIYRSLAEIDAPITDAVRDVFDRLLLTPEEAWAKASRRPGPRSPYGRAEEADWRALAERGRSRADPQALDAIRAAERMPDPGSVRSETEAGPAAREEAVATPPMRESAAAVPQAPEAAAAAPAATPAEARAISAAAEPVGPPTVPDLAPIADTPIANGIGSFAPQVLGVDAKRFQFKDATDERGVSERLSGVNRWDPIKAGVVLVWQDAAGKLWIADGHQRLGLALRLQAADPAADIRLNGYLLREQDGIGAADARTIAALKNIAEGTGTAVDAAKVLRDHPAGAAELPPRSELYRQAQGLANLGHEAFGAVVNEVVPANYAAIVGRLMPTDPVRQQALISLLAKTEPANAAQAEAIVRQGIAAGFERAAQSDMFGDLEVASSLYAERAKVLDRALKTIRRDKTVFEVLTREQTQIEAAGNRLAAEVNEKRAAADAQALQLLQILSSRTGPISDALANAARAAKETGNYAGAARDFTAELRRLVEAGELVRAADGVARGPLHAGGEGTGLLLERAPERAAARAERAAGEQAAELIAAERERPAAAAVAEDEAARLFEQGAKPGATGRVAEDAPLYVGGRAAPRMPEPMLPKPRSAAAKAAAEEEARAIELYEAALADGRISEAERARVDEALAAIDGETQARTRVLRDGVGCLLAGLGLA